MCRLPFPHNFIAKVLCAKDGIKDDFEVVGSGGVTVKVEAAGGFEDAVQFKEAVCHHDEVSHHIRFFEEAAEGLDHFGDIGVGVFEDFEEFMLGLITPVPGIFKGGDLGIRLVPFGGFEEEVVIALGVEGGIKVDEVYGFIFDVVTEDVEVITEVEGVGHGGCPF